MRNIRRLASGKGISSARLCFNSENVKYFVTVITAISVHGNTNPRAIADSKEISRNFNDAAERDHYVVEICVSSVIDFRKYCAIIDF